MPDRIRTETNDLIVLDENRLFKLFLGAISITVTAWIGYEIITGKSIFEVKLFFIVWTVIFFFFFGWYSLVRETVTIDKKSQSIIIQKNSPIKHFESVKKISFSALREIKIDKWYSEDGSANWRIYLIQTYNDKPVYIYTPIDEWDAKRIAEKIRRITNKERKECPVEGCSVSKLAYRGLARHIAMQGNNDDKNIHTQYKKSKGILKQWRTGEEITKITDEIMKVEGWEDKEDLIKQA